MKIANFNIGQNYSPFIIAEMSGNHNNSLDRALKIVDAAAEAGVQALKIQTYTADTMTLDLKEGDFFINDPKSLWKGRSLYDLYKEAHTPWEWHKPIFERCCQRGIIGFSTPFDSTSVDFLEGLDIPFYKIASFENTDIPLIKKVASIGRPMIISTGMASIEDLDLTVKTVEKAGIKDLILLKCTSSYPATPQSSNLLTIPHLRKLFDVEVGLSDHSMGHGVACASIAMGASVIEKHFTLCRADGGVDSAFSLEPHEMKTLVVETKRAWQSLGRVAYGPSEIEKKSVIFKRSLYIAKDVKKGEILTCENLKSIRPGRGLPPKYYEMLIGKRVNREIKRGTPVSWDIF